MKQLQLINPKDLTAYDKNVKFHDPEQVSRIAESIKRFGFDQPIVVDKDRVIIKGHGRQLAAIKLGLDMVPVLVRDDLSPDEVKAARLADNRVALGDIDTVLFREELAELNYDLSGIFDAKELDFALADLGEINDDAFIDDLASAVDEQNQQTLQKMEDAAAKRIPLYKVLGYKDIVGADQLHVTRLQAHMEEITGEKGDAALVAFAKQVAAEKAA